MQTAYSLGKICFALPGRADMETFTGSHDLIKAGKAKLMTSVEDLFPYINAKRALPSQELPLLIGLGTDEQNILQLFTNQEVNIEYLTQKSGLAVAKVSALLIGLILKKRVRELPGKNYKRILNGQGPNHRRIARQNQNSKKIFGPGYSLNPRSAISAIFRKKSLASMSRTTSSPNT